MLIIENTENIKKTKVIHNLKKKKKSRNLCVTNDKS